MSFALRLDDLAARLVPPAELLEPIRFMPKALRPEVVAELKRLTNAAQEYRARASASGQKVLLALNTLERVASGPARPDAYDFSDDGTIVGILTEGRALSDRLLSRLEGLRAKRQAAEDLDGPDRAAVMSLLDPLIEGIGEGMGIVDRVVDVTLRTVRQASGIDDTAWFGETGVDRFIDSHAAHAYVRIVREETGLPCDAGWVELCGEFFNELRIHVPADLALPHRHLKPALDRVHERVAGIHPRYRGRITFEFIRSA